MRIIFKRNGQLECAEVSRVFIENEHLCLALKNECLASKTNIYEEKLQNCIKSVCQNGTLDIRDIDFALKETVSTIEKDEKYSILLTNTPLSARAFNQLVLYMNNVTGRKNKDPVCQYTLKDVYLNVPFLEPVRHCGKNTAKEIADVFESYGFDVTHWRAELKVWNTTAKYRKPEDITNMRARLWEKLDEKKSE